MDHLMQAMFAIANKKAGASPALRNYAFSA